MYHTYICTYLAITLTMIPLGYHHASFASSGRKGKAKARRAKYGPWLRRNSKVLRPDGTEITLGPGEPE